jgi:hypothetical protein
MGFNSLKFIGAKYPSSYPQCIKFTNAFFLKTIDNAESAVYTYREDVETPNTALNICICKCPQ